MPRRQALAGSASAGPRDRGPAGPSLRGGYWTWRDRRGGVVVRFTGRGPRAEAAEVLAAVSGAARPVARARQVHSDRVLEARPGWCGRGDALIASSGGPVLAVATADCVPVLVAGGEQVAAIHAGWRGIAAGIVGKTLAALGGEAPALAAWIGPAIGPCCYEVGPEVAEKVAAASSEAVVLRRPGGRPHLDLPAAVAAQLAGAGLTEVRRVEACTRCLAERLWSYRREGPSTGRNFAFVWREPEMSSRGV